MGIVTFLQRQNEREIRRSTRRRQYQRALSIATRTGVEDRAIDRLLDAEFRGSTAAVVEDDESDIGDRWDGRDHNDQEQWR